MTRPGLPTKRILYNPYRSHPSVSEAWDEILALLDAGLNREEIRVLLCLWKELDSMNWSSDGMPVEWTNIVSGISRPRLARRAEVKPEQLNPALQKLRDCGLVEILHGPAGEDAFKLNAPSEWEIVQQHREVSRAVENNEQRLAIDRLKRAEAKARKAAKQLLGTNENK
jgi:hypothetical protein